jgi:hypothetical protein
MQQFAAGVRCAALSAVGLTMFLWLSGCDAWTTAQGTVRDSAGNPVPDAIVTMNVAGASRQFRTDKDGQYLISTSQAPWKTSVSLTVSKNGYQPYEKKFTGPGSYKELDVVLDSVRVEKPGTPQETDSAQSIPKALFPNAPEKTQGIDCFRGLAPDMSIYAVVQKCGRPDEELGSGIFIFVWHLADGSTVSIGTPYLERIGRVQYTNAAGKTSGTKKHH